MNKISDVILSKIDDIDTRKALGLGPRKLSVDRYINIPHEWDGFKFLPGTNSIIRYRNNGYISTHIFIKPIKQISHTMFLSIPDTYLMIYKYDYKKSKDEVIFHPEFPEGVIFNLQ